MPRQPRANQPSPPEWWNPSLYSYLSELPLAGWVWEFMRRDRLKMLRPGQPADVMNRDQNDEAIPWHLSPYYEPWPPRRSPEKFLTVPSAVRWEGVTHTRRHRHTYLDLTHYELEDESVGQDPPPPAQWVQLEIDLNRRNALIVRDLKIALKAARKKYGDPQRINQRMEDWIDNHVLEVWDLRELGVPFPEIIDLPGMFDKKIKNKENRKNVMQAAYNAYNSANERIEGKGWKLLALQVAETWPDVEIGG